MFIKLTVTHFLTLKPYCFWTFRSRYVKILNLTQTKRLPNPVLLLFPDSCFDQAGRSLEEEPRRNKIYVPNLDRWTPLQNWHQPQVHIFFLGKRVTCLSAFAPRKRKPCQYYLHFLLKTMSKTNHIQNKVSSLKSICLTCASRTNTEIDSKKRLPNPGNQHLTLSNLCSWSLEGKLENNICIR